MSSRFKPWGLRVLIMQCRFIRSFCFYLDQILMLSLEEERPSSMLLKFFGLIGSDISMLSSKQLSFYQLAGRGLQQGCPAETQWAFPFLMKLESCGNFFVMAQELSYPWGKSFIFREGSKQNVVTNHSFNVNMFQYK